MAVGMACPAFAEADKASGLDRTTANTLSGNYLAALVAGLSSDTSAAAQFYAESLKFDPHSADLAERAADKLRLSARGYTRTLRVARAREIQPTS